MRNSTEPLLEYALEANAWHWRGALVGNPAADEAAARIERAFAEVYQYLSEVHPKDAQSISRITMRSEELLEIETGGDDFVLQNQGGFPWVHVVGRYRPATVADFSPVAPKSGKGNKVRFRPIADASAWKDAAPRSDASQGALFHQGLSRVALSALRDVKREPARQALSSVLLEKDGRDLLAVATDGHRMSVHRFVGQGAYAEFGKHKCAPVPLPVVRDLVKNVLLRGREFSLDVFFDLRLSGSKGTYSWTPQNSPADAWQGLVVADGREYPVPVLDPENYPNWRGVLPKAGELSWEAALDAEQALEQLKELNARWAEGFRQTRSTAPKGKDRSVYGRLGPEELLLYYPLPQGSEEVLSVSVPVRARRGLKQPVPFLMNPKYLEDALKTVGGEFLLAGYSPDTAGADGVKYLSRPLVFLDAGGPTQTIVMPMWPPRNK